MPDKPFPFTEGGINLLLQTLAINLATYKIVLPVLQADIDFIEAAAENFQYLINTSPLILDAKEAYTKFKEAYFNLPVGGKEPDVIVFPVIAVPNPTVVGLITETKAIIKRIKSAAGYNEVIGEALGLIDGGSDPILDNLTAALKLKALSASRVEITFSKQGQSAMQVEFKRKGELVWSIAGVYTSSPAIHNAPSDDPEAREYRGFLTKKDVAVGNISPIYTVVTTP